jgi:hypothetical protein
MRIAFIFPLLLIASAFACSKHKSKISTEWNEYASPRIENVRLYDSIPALAKHHLAIKELHGIKVNYISGRSASYFEYEADAEKLIKTLGALPFLKSNEVSDTLCREMQHSFSLSGNKVLSAQEIKAASFFWKINTDEYQYYECIKWPSRHTLLINKTTGRILHRVEA